MGVYLFVPNLIGYVRVVLMFVGYAYALPGGRLGHDHTVTIAAYMFAQLLDVADGHAARMLNQSSKFGAVLDMVTDRTSTTCFCIILAQLYPEYTMAFVGLVALDMFSHWFHMYTSVLVGQTSHKVVDHWLLRMYYWRPWLFLVCSGTESWYMCLYTLKFTSGPVIYGVPFVVGFFRLCTIAFAFKQTANVVQLLTACNALVRHDEAEIQAVAKKAASKKK
jgi:CDP-diacylglycerol--inositol 3-phosphatidyltransferase